MLARRKKTYKFRIKKERIKSSYDRLLVRKYTGVISFFIVRFREIYME